MTFPTITASNTSAEASNVTTHTVSLPATVNNGDLIRIEVGINGNPTVTQPSGYGMPVNIAGSNCRHAIFELVADGTEGGTTVTFSTSAAEQSNHTSRSIGDWSGTLAGTEYSTGAIAASDSPDSDSLAPSWGTEDTLYITSYGSRRGRAITSFPTNYGDNNLESIGMDGTAGAAVASGTRNLAASSDDPGAFLLSALTPWAAVTTAIRPAAGVTSVLTGTAIPTITEDDITTGGKTIIITLVGDTWKVAGTGPIGSTADTQALIDGFDAASSPTNGWNNEVRDKALTSEIVRTSATVATWTIAAEAGYDITATETITGTIPTAALTTGAGALTSTPTFTITAVAGGLPMPVAMYNYRRRRA